MCDMHDHFNETRYVVDVFMVSVISFKSFTTAILFLFRIMACNTTFDTIVRGDVYGE
jgi:hypothetical protein